MSGKNARRSPLAALLLAFLAVLVQPAALKAEDDEVKLSGSLGVGAAVRPEFEGSHRYTTQAMPVVNFRYGPAFLTMGQGLGVHLPLAPGWSVAPSLRYRWARREKKSELLKGLGNIKAGAEAGGTLRWQPGPAGLALKVFQGVGRADGLTAELEASYGTLLTESLKGSVSLSTMFADRAYNRDYFGITPTQSANSGYQVYDPKAGFKHVGVSCALGYALTESLELGLMAGYKRLTGPAAESPLVKRGSADQFLSALSVGVNF
jgi:outer membrane scaffolding protein for murein synthesis (MipA/OmpV family)